MSSTPTRVHDSAEGASRTTSRANGIIARAARAHEDPQAMTSDANWSRMARHCAEIVRRNPDLTAEQIAKAARLTVKAEMAALSRKAAEARKARAAERAAAEAQADAAIDAVITDSLTA